MNFKEKSDSARVIRTFGFVSVTGLSGEIFNLFVAVFCPGGTPDFPKISFRSPRRLF